MRDGGVVATKDDVGNAFYTNSGANKEDLGVKACVLKLINYTPI